MTPKGQLQQSQIMNSNYNGLKTREKLRDK